MIPESIPRVIPHPATGAPLLLVEEQTSFAREARFTDREFGNPETGKRQLETLRRKESEVGYLYRDPATGYEHRYLPDADAAAASTRDDTRDREPRSGPVATAETVDERRRRLRAELEQLERQ